MLKQLLSITTLALLSATTVAQPVAIHFGFSQTYINNEGEYLIVESRDTADSNQAFPAVVAAIEKAGYRRNLTGRIAPGSKTDTWCKVDVYMQRQILGECYTPQMGHGISVRNHLAWTQQEFKADYSGVPTMIAKIRDEHRRASAALGIKS